MAVERLAVYSGDPLEGGRLLSEALGAALVGDDVDTPLRRAAIETALLHALTWLTPADTTLQMARAATLEALLRMGPSGAAPHARLERAWTALGID